MLAATSLRTLARIIDDDGALAALDDELDRVDPVLRLVVGHRVRNTIRRAIALVPADADDHAVARCAFLLTAGVPATDAARGLGYDERRAAVDVRPRRWWATGVTAVAVVGACIAGVLASSGASAGEYDPAAPARGATRNAYERGGVPVLASAPGHEAFATHLPAFVSLNTRLRDGAPALDSARDKVVSDAVRGSLGDDVTQHLAHVLDAIAAARTIDAAASRLRHATTALNGSLAEAGLAYYVDPSVTRARFSDRNTVMLYVFRVARVVHYHVDDGTAIRVLHLRRLDRLNRVRNRLGYTSADADEALVDLTTVERALIDLALPALAPSGLVHVHDTVNGRTPAWASEAAQLAADAIRSELLAVDGVDVLRAARLGALVRRRNALFAGWQIRMVFDDVTFRRPYTYRVRPSELEGIEPWVDRGELAELADIDRTLASPSIGGVFDALYGSQILSVELHEVQHRLDYEHPGGLPIPSALMPVIGRPRVRGKLRPLARRVADETSAFLGQLARDDRATYLTIVQLAKFVLAPDGNGRVYTDAAEVVLTGLREELELDTPPLRRNGRRDRDAVAATFMALVQTDASDIRQAAAAVWERYYGRPLPALRRGRQ